MGATRAPRAGARPFLTEKHRFAVKNHFLSGITVLPLLRIVARHWRSIDWLRYGHRVLFLAAMAVVNSALAVPDRLLFDARAAAAPRPERPVFVLGHPRTGTTHLHNLLARDPRFATATTFAAGFPSAFLSLWHARSALAGLLDETRPMDSMAITLDTPCEDEIATCALSGGESPYMAIVLPRSWREFWHTFRFEARGASYRRWRDSFLFFLKKARAGGRGARASASASFGGGGGARGKGGSGRLRSTRVSCAGEKKGRDGPPKRRSASAAPSPLGSSQTLPAWPSPGRSPPSPPPRERARPIRLPIARSLAQLSSRPPPTLLPAPQVLLRAPAGSRAVVKSPVHTCRVSLLLELFPDAQFVYIHRDPYEVFASSAHMADTYYWYTTLQRPDEGAMADFIFEQFRLLHDAYVSERSLVPAGNLCEVSFAELDGDPVGTLRRVYATLGWEGFDALEPSVRGYLSQLEGFKKNSLEPIAPEHRARIEREWAGAFEAFGYERRAG